MREEVQEQGVADSAEMHKAIADLASRMDAPIIRYSQMTREESRLRDRRDVECPVEQPVVKSGCARPVRKAHKPFAKRVSPEGVQSAGDLIVRIKEDSASATQARLVMGLDGLTIQEVEGTHILGSYYRTLNDRFSTGGYLVGTRVLQGTAPGGYQGARVAN